jgi:hypothetical protein
LLPLAFADQSVSFATFSSADRSVFYLSAERDEGLAIRISNGTETIAFDHHNELPRGIWVSPLSRTSSEYVIHVDKRVKLSELQIPSTYGINFYNPNEPDETADILLIFDGEDSATVSFDRDSYSSGEQATLAVKDPHFDCIVPDMLPDGKSVQVALIVNGDSQILDVPRDPNGDDRFVRTFQVPDNIGIMEAHYTSESRCAFPSDIEEAGDSAQIAADKISFDRASYAYQDSVTMTVTTSSLGVSPIEIRASKIVDGQTVPIQVDAASSSLVPEPGETAGTLTTTLPLNQLLDLASFSDSGIATIEARYGGDEGAQDVATVLAERRTSVLIPDGRISFFTNDTADIQLAYPEWNGDPLAFDTNHVTLCSYDAPNGVAIPGGRTVVTVAETGWNTGIFVNSYHIAFIKPDFANTSLPPAEQELFQNTTLKVPWEVSSSLLAKMGNESCPELLPTSTPLEPVVTVNPSVNSDPDSEGRGQNIGAVPHESPTYTVSQVNCNQYNYGPDNDGDGICDNWETSSGLKVYYPAGGNSWTLSYTNDPAPKSDHLDVFVEMDYVNNLAVTTACNDGRTSGGNNYKPNTAAVNNVESAFRGAPIMNDNGVNGIELHIYLDDAVNPSDECYDKVSVFGVYEDAPTYDEIKTAQFGRDSSERLSTNKGKAKFQVFHYGLSIPRQAQDMPSSGVAEQLGNDFVVSLGASGIGWSDANMGGTIMHELGHNLGLYHGGPDVAGNDYNVNCKPNYPSVMTYVRQLTNAYSNSTLKYSDDPLSPGSISRVAPNENNILKLTSLSWMGLVELVWGIDPGSPGGPITVLSGDSTQTPAIDGDVRETLSDIDWDGDGNIADGSVPGNNIANLGIGGCSGSDTDNMISGGDDWENLEYNFRSLNPDSFETGFGDLQYYPLEVNTTIVTEIRSKGVNTTDFLLANIAETEFELDASCSDSIIDFANATFDIEDPVKVILTDGGINRDSGIEEDVDIRIRSTVDPEGIILTLSETGASTGVFSEEFLITASMNTSEDEITVQDGEKVIIEYEDICDAGPTEIGSDFHVSFIVGGTDADVAVSEVTIPVKVKSEYHNKLVNGSKLNDQAYLKGGISNMTVLELVALHDLEAAESELLAMRKYLDGWVGGNKTDDLFKEEWQTIRARQFLDNLLASFIEANLTDINRTNFELVSFDVDCSSDSQPFEPCIINGYSDTATSTSDTLRVEPAKKRMTLDLAGQGNVTLVVPNKLLSNGTLSYVRSLVHGGAYEFSMTASNNSSTTYLVRDLALHPRHVVLLYGSDLVSPSAVGVLDAFGSPATKVTAGEQLVLFANLTNYGSWVQNFTALIEVRDSSGITYFLGDQTGTVDADGMVQVQETWVSDEPGVYTLRVFVTSDLSNPEVLSLVHQATFEVEE